MVVVTYLKEKQQQLKLQKITRGAQSSSTTNTPTSSQTSSGNNHTITALDGHKEPAIEARRLKGKCKVNDKIFNFSLDSGCDLTTISAKVAEEAVVEYLDGNKYMPQLADGFGLELSKAKVKLTLGAKSSHIMVTILPTLPVDILIGLDVLSQHPELKPVYEKLRDVVEKLDMGLNRSMSEIVDDGECDLVKASV